MNDSPPLTGAVFSHNGKGHTHWWCSQECFDNDCEFGPCCYPKKGEGTVAEKVMTENVRGEWVQAIPEPFYFLGLFRSGVRCECGEKRKSRQSYREHYAYTHILGMSP